MDTSSEDYEFRAWLPPLLMESARKLPNMSFVASDWNVKSFGAAFGISQCANASIWALLTKCRRGDE